MFVKHPPRTIILKYFLYVDSFNSHNKALKHRLKFYSLHFTEERLSHRKIKMTCSKLPSY